MNKGIFLQRYGFLLLCVLVVLCNLPALWGGFYSDDRAYLLYNPVITELPFEQMWRLFTPINHIEFLPIRDLTFYLEYQIFGALPLGYKINNIVIYLLLGYAVFLATQALLKVFAYQQASSQTNSLIALLITALFMLHPTHVESVAWISGRKDLLAGLFTFLALWLFCQALLAINNNKQCLIYFVGSWLLFTAALLSKSAALPLVGILLLLAFIRLQQVYPLRKSIFSTILISAPFFLLAIFMVWVYREVGVDNGIAQIGNALSGLTIAERLSTALQILGNLTQIALWPTELRLHYSASPSELIVTTRLLLGGMLIVVCCWALWAALARRSIIAFGVLFFAAFNLIYLQWIPFSTWSLSSERFLIISVYGFSVIAALLITQLSKNKMFAVIAIVLILFSGQTVHRSEDWQSSEQIVIANWQADPDYLYPIWERLKVVDLPQRDWEQAFKLLENVEPEKFQPILNSFTRFYFHLNAFNESRNRQQMEMAEQYVQQANDLFRGYQIEQLSLADRYLLNMLGEALKEIYRDLLQYHKNDAVLHYQAAQFLYYYRPQFEKRRITAYLQTALALNGLSPQQRDHAYQLLMMQSP